MKKFLNNLCLILIYPVVAILVLLIVLAYVVILPFTLTYATILGVRGLYLESVRQDFSNLMEMLKINC